MATRDRGVKARKRKRHGKKAAASTISSTHPSPSMPRRFECIEHTPTAVLEEAILRMDFPMGALPVRGYRCPACGIEEFPAEEVAMAEALAERLGFFQARRGRRRTLWRQGKDTTVSLLPEFLRRHGKGPGDTVVVAERGDELVIRVE